MNKTLLIFCLLFCGNIQAQTKKEIPDFHVSNFHPLKCIAFKSFFSSFMSGDIVPVNDSCVLVVNYNLLQYQHFVIAALNPYSGEIKYDTVNTSGLQKDRSFHSFSFFDKQKQELKIVVTSPSKVITLDAKNKFAIKRVDPFSDSLNICVSSYNCAQQHFVSFKGAVDMITPRKYDGWLFKMDTENKITPVYKLPLKYTCFLPFSYTMPSCIMNSGHMISTDGYSYKLYLSRTTSGHITDSFSLKKKDWLQIPTDSIAHFSSLGYPKDITRWGLGKSMIQNILPFNDSVFVVFHRRSASSALRLDFYKIREDKIVLVKEDLLLSSHPSADMLSQPDFKTGAPLLVKNGYFYLSNSNTMRFIHNKLYVLQMDYTGMNSFSGEMIYQDYRNSWKKLGNEGTEWYLGLLELSINNLQFLE